MSKDGYLESSDASLKTRHVSRQLFRDLIFLRTYYVSGHMSPDLACLQTLVFRHLMSKDYMRLETTTCLKTVLVLRRVMTSLSLGLFPF